MTKWMFFFDVDEFLHVPVKETISSVMNLWRNIFSLLLN
jgi:hypothetical protein